ncbi:MAG: DJ-1/PfpI family protein, partial [Acidimicrobiia bacterium]
MLIGILLYPNVDLLDSGGPYEVFLTASRLAVRDGDPPPFDVETITIDGKAVTAYGGLVLQPSTSVAEVGELDVVIVPGTTDISVPLGDPDLIRAVKTLQAKSRLTASVCTGAFVLGTAGILEGLNWTTHWEDVDELADSLGSD